MTAHADQMTSNPLFRRFAPYESRLPCQRRRKADGKACAKARRSVAERLSDEDDFDTSCRLAETVLYEVAAYGRLRRAIHALPRLGTRVRESEPLNIERRRRIARAGHRFPHSVFYLIHAGHQNYVFRPESDRGGCPCRRCSPASRRARCRSRPRHTRRQAVLCA